VVTKLDSGLLRLLAEAVSFLRGADPILHGRVAPESEGRYDHLGEAEVLCPGETVCDAISEFGHADVAASALQAGGFDALAEIGSAHLTELRESGSFVADWRAELDGLDSVTGNLPQGAIEVLANLLPKRPGLTAKGHSQRWSEGV